MGLFKELALLPLAPVRGTVWVAEQIAEEAERQLYDEDQIKRELLQLELDHDKGLIGDEERERMERELFDRLAIARLREAQEPADPTLTPDYPDDTEVVDRG
jgi:gas vesicle protein GvpG